MRYYGTNNTEKSLATIGGKRAYDVYDIKDNGNIVIGKSIPVNAQPYLWYFCNGGQEIIFLDNGDVRRVMVNGAEYDFDNVGDSRCNKKYTVNFSDGVFVARVVKFEDRTLWIETQRLGNMTYPTRCPNVFIENHEIVCRRMPKAISPDINFAMNPEIRGQRHDLYIERMYERKSAGVKRTKFVRLIPHRGAKKSVSKWSVRFRAYAIAKRRWRSAMFSERVAKGKYEWYKQ